MKTKLRLLVALCMFAFVIKSQVLSTFTVVYQTTQKGGIVFLSNSSLGCSANPPAPTSSCVAGTTVMPPSGSLKDNDFNTAYIDIDGDVSTFMSSSDSLNLPACSQITKAYLFWGTGGQNSGAHTTPSLTTCKLKVGSGSYQTITAIASKTNTAGFETYHCYADVTSLIQGGGIKSRITVADIASNAVTKNNTFGSWNIVVVYRNDLLTMRQLTIFNGLANVDNSNTPISIPVSGFLSPTSGPITLEMGLFVHDGDRSSTGDGLSFKGMSGAGTFVPISDAINPSNDIMNSTVSNSGTLTPFRKPNMNNNAGSDADIFELDNTTKNYIGNSATSATLNMTTGGETYLTQMVTTAIDVYEPDLRASVKVIDANGGLLVPGDILEYRIKGVNIGSDPSVNTFITDTLDIRADYIPNSTKIIYGPGTGTLSDVSGDDRLDYNATTRVLKIRIGSGASSSIGGTITNSPAGVDSTIITYSVMCTNSCIKIACSPSINAQAFIWGTGAVSSNTYNNGSNPGVFDGNGCPIPGTTSSPITATACAVSTASNNGPGCIGTSVLLSAPTDTGVTYSWSGPGSYASSIQNPTLSNVTATMAGVYNVTLAVSSSTCKAVKNTTLVTAVCVPTVVSDATVTLINTPVSGSAATNDSNVGSATFSITNQPSGGTVTINSANGQYTFTPSPTFTGITTSTYSACNGTSCASTSITFTVHPNIVANPDVINTTPSVTTTGSLLTNDSGITSTLGATYTVSVTQPSASTGTITINPTTGQYTFTPNPSFNGTTQTTYTVCNTAVNPQQCSNTTITINVKPNPAPVNDATTTVINTSVVANAATNDGGTAGGTFSITGQSTNGTVTINSSTGQYTFTPATSFTGVTTATYNLCNGAPVSCSNAVISITVHPNLVANPDIINTTPSVTTTGTLLTNDGGITSTLGATYTVSVTQPSASTGTITINPTTGQYTFTPNPSFTGTTQTTYTVCNTAVNPQQCSNTTITINVFPNPAPVNDATTTVINTSVVANAANNDGGTAGGTFSITGQSTNGTVTINSSTGQYTFTPATSFTGVTTATYNLCNGAPVSCSNAVISITVHPNLVANPDVINTTPSVTTTGTLLTNDSGITSTLGATYTVSVTQPSASTGTITINPTTGQYTFTPNPSFTGTTQTTYTVCNTAVNPQQCSNTTITINVLSNPAPVNDATTTVINTSVIANAATNDGGTAGGTFSITGQSTNGTVSINSSTGQYTFTPATSFTGVTTATYNLCNGAPVSCSNAVISITVHPNLVANPDIINTTPSVTTTGTLLTNDSGITSTLGATYTVSVTQPSASTGTITINPTTGQYTFTPNPSFTGTTQTTYTVCNTAVNPQQCSNTTITINVKPNPAPVNDATTTVINTSVVANAATNDGGTTGGTFSITGQSSNGTVTINSSTGQYTFTPATSFTGVTTATYNLCNGAPVSCSNAVISITVHPNLVANPDIINTTPSVTTTGSLLTNDSGITSTLGATYTVSVTQPAASTGTITINPTTGQYTFTPNPSFTGSTQTTYTVCNTAVNPQQCSNTTITINVLSNPAPVNDATTTVINTSVVANAATNDGGTAGGTFSITGQSANGTVTINSSTGQYTFTPATSFTGVTTATYNLCNGAPVSCSNAVISITVHPNLVANPDIINTTPSVTTTGTLLTNDAGITSTLGATYTVSVTQPSASTGTITINPTTGQYTFTPNPSFTGTTQTTYTVCNTAVNPQQCSNTTITINVKPNPAPVNDATTTVINTSVVANAATNDGGTAGGTFSITGQSTNGTVTINSSTGQYTFTPATSFTGVTTATYNLCNGAPITCSNAVITISVYPALQAIPDVVTTTPSVTATGSLLTNDIGVLLTGTLTANYSVSITQPSASVGAFTINPTNGQYTFAPNSSFTGTASTTYTVCNTSVNPIICSSASILIQSGIPPVAVNDATTTLINTAVSGSAATNDSGVLSALNPTFTVGALNPGTGTITINSTTGVFSYTPASGFTGTTSATYTVCNLLLTSNCPTATIRFSVYPAIGTNSDVISTTPSVAVTGSLLTNDTGILTTGTLTGTYSVSVIPTATTTGTISVNSTTGQYTFTPNPAFVGSVQTTYQVCNLSVNPNQCSSTIIVIYVYPNPGPVNDATNTVSGATVSGNASSNDTGTTSATYSITGQPSGGTISIVSNTGVYTFTPAPTFTGITTATYQLCNGAATSCSNAIITITVHPLIVANPDVINALPTSTVNGNLLTNDAGITTTLGSTYTVTIVQTPTSVGTFTLNGTTGQYTFIPNPNFSGTVQTTYQVCNTAVNPIQCSTSTVTINVFPYPAPVDDATTTAMGIPVSGDASTNDLGTAGGTYSIIVQPSGGTVSINSSNGQYTFTPSPSFTGVTTATYNLCNGAPVTCSTAVITITVHPNIVANPDIINTTPSVSATGSLLTNDSGITSTLGATYSVTVTQPASTTGTIIVNPATGEYTFIPNPTYVGTSQTTYTVCNTAVVAPQCSSSTITINVFPNPAPVDDATLTLINTPVSGIASANDSGVEGGTYSITGQPNGGTVTIDPNTGQYTFTPSPSFTGVTTATYNLCNGAPITCSTAIITITVFPQLLANPDFTTTSINTSVNGTLITNDDGIVSYGTYSVTITQPSVSVGAFTVNPITGQYTFTPATGYTGTMTTTYTICQYNGTVQMQCSSATVTIIVGAKAMAGVSKAISNVVYNTDNTVNLTYKVVVKNMGNQPLTNVSVADNLNLTYPSPSAFTVVQAPVISNTVGTQISLNAGYNGKTSTLLTEPLTSSLAIGRTDTILFTVKINPNGYSGSFNNSATITAMGSGTTITDVSDSGLNPDKDNDTDPTNNTSPTTFTFNLVKIGIAKSASKSEYLGGNNYKVRFRFTVKNYGTSPIYNISVSDNLDNAFPIPASYTVIGTPICVNNYLKPNNQYNGSGNSNLLVSTSSLGVAKADTIVLDIRYHVVGEQTFSNVATAIGFSSPTGGFSGTDNSTSGNDPDPNNNNNPNDNGESEPTVFAPELQVIIPEGFSPNNDGVNDVFFIRGLEHYPGNEISILNRWGNLVYKKVVYDNTWDGTANQGVSFGGNVLPEGTYFYIIDLGEGKKPIKGYVYLNRK